MTFYLGYMTKTTKQHKFLKNKEDRPRITLLTVPNGYTLDIRKGEASHGFLYFNLDKLLSGFIYHVGMEELGSATMEKRQEIIEAAVNWRDNKKNIQELQKRNAEVERMREDITAMSGKIADQRSIINKLRDTFAILREHANKVSEDKVFSKRKNAKCKTKKDKKQH